MRDPDVMWCDCDWGYGKSSLTYHRAWCLYARMVRGRYGPPMRRLLTPASGR